MAVRGQLGPVSLGIVKVPAVTRASGSRPGGGTRFCIADVCIRKPGTPALPSAGLGTRAANASEGAHRAHLPGCGLGCPGPRSHGTRTGTGHCATACPLRRPKASGWAGHIHRLQPAERLAPQGDQRLRGSAHRRLPLRSATSPSNGGSAPMLRSGVVRGSTYADGSLSQPLQGGSPHADRTAPGARSYRRRLRAYPRLRPWTLASARAASDAGTHGLNGSPDGRRNQAPGACRWPGTHRFHQLHDAAGRHK